MTRLIKPDDNTAWRDLFDHGIARSAFRLEGLPSYDVPAENEAVERFVRGEPSDVDTAWWESMVRRHKATGRPFIRVRIVPARLTDYIRWQLTIYPRFDAAGEEIRIVVSPEAGWPQDLPDHDFWLFDDRDVWLMRYSETGAYLGAELPEDPTLLADHCRWRDIAIAQSMPLQDFLATRRRAS